MWSVCLTSNCLISSHGLSSCCSLHYTVHVFMWLFSKWKLISHSNNPLVLCGHFVFPGLFSRLFVISLVWFIARFHKFLSDIALNVQTKGNLNGFIRMLKCLFLLSFLYLQLSVVSVKISLALSTLQFSLLLRALHVITACLLVPQG